MASTKFRKLELVAGVVAITAGLIYMFVGVPGVAQTGNGSVGPGQMYILGAHFTYSLGSRVSIQIHWSADHNVTVLLLACGQDSTCKHPLPSGVSDMNGTSGSMAFSTSKGNYFAFEATGVTSLSYSGSTEYPFFWLAIIPIFVGIPLVAFAFLVKPREQTSPLPPGAPDSPSLEKVLEELRRTGTSVAYKCPECGRGIKINDSTEASSLEKCPNCSHELDQGALVDYLREFVE